MKFAKIPKALIPENGQWADFGPPPGHEANVGRLEVVIRPDPEFFREFMFLVELEPGDVDEIRAGARLFWVGQVGEGLQPVTCGPMVPAELREVGRAEHEESPAKPEKPPATSEHHAPFPLTHFLNRCECGIILTECGCLGPKPERTIRPCMHKPA